MRVNKTSNDKPSECTFYKIINKENGKVYIGQTLYYERVDWLRKAIENQMKRDGIS